MRKTLITITLAILLAVPMLASAAPEPWDSSLDYMLETAVWDVAQEIYDTTTVVDQDTYQQVMLARKIVKDQPQSWRYVLRLLQARQTNGEVNWAALTYGQVKTSLNNEWSSLAAIFFAADPVAP